MGGGSFDVSLLNFTEQTFEAKATAGDAHFGSQDVKNRIIDLGIFACNGDGSLNEVYTSWKALSSREIGLCFPAPEKRGPLNSGSTDAKMERYTAVEIKHGRISMIAVLGYLMPETSRSPGCERQPRRSHAARQWSATAASA